MTHEEALKIRLGLDDAILHAEEVYRNISRAETLTDLSNRERRIRDVMLELQYTVNRLGYWYQEAVGSRRYAITHPESVIPPTVQRKLAIVEAEDKTKNSEGEAKSKTKTKSKLKSSKGRKSLVKKSPTDS